MRIGDLFQWDRFVTPTVIKFFYWLAVVISILVGLAGVVSSLASMAMNPFVGMIFLISSVLGACMGVILSRIVAEFVLIVFRINEHLGAIRNQGSGLGPQQ
jgi:hypothetical protein